MIRITEQKKVSAFRISILMAFLYTNSWECDCFRKEIPSASSLEYKIPTLVETMPTSTSSWNNFKKTDPGEIQIPRVAWFKQDAGHVNMAFVDYDKWVSLLLIYMYLMESHSIRGSYRSCQDYPTFHISWLCTWTYSYSKIMIGISWTKRRWLYSF